MIANDSSEDVEILKDICSILIFAVAFSILLSFIFEYIEIENYVCVLY